LVADFSADRMTKELLMAAMKPRTGDGPMEVAKEGRVIVMRVPLEGGGRLVVALNSEEAADLGAQLVQVAKTAGPTLRPINQNS
jgi:hypothetical protein